MSIDPKEIAPAFDTIVNARRSVRGYLPMPVEPSLLEHIFRIAARTPSNCNTQPWAVHVVSGEKLEALRALLPANTAQGKMTLDFPYDMKYQGVFRERQIDAAVQMYGALGIAREDKARRNEVFMRNYAFFGAPHVALL